MINLHVYSSHAYLDDGILRPVTIYRYILDCDGYELTHFETNKECEQQDAANRLLRSFMVLYKGEQLYKFLGYNLTPGLEYHNYKISDTTMNELLKDKKKWVIQHKLEEIEGDFEDAR